MRRNVSANRDWLKRRINVARAEKGLSWRAIADAMTTAGRPVSANALMSKHSRGSFTAVELIALLQVLGVNQLKVPRQP